MRYKERRLRAIVTATAVLAVLCATLLSGCGGTPAKASPTPTADPTAQAVVSDVDALTASIADGLDLDAISDDLDAPLPTGPSADVAPLLTEAASMAKDLATAVPTVDAGT